MSELECDISFGREGLADILLALLVGFYSLCDGCILHSLGLAHFLESSDSW